MMALADVFFVMLAAANIVWAMHLTGRMRMVEAAEAELARRGGDLRERHSRYCRTAVMYQQHMNHLNGEFKQAIEQLAAEYQLLLEEPFDPNSPECCE
jgi:hypothetical protein